MKTFTQAVDAYLADAEDWLTDADLPLTVGLQAAAQELDKKITGNVLSQYRLLLSELEKRRPVASDEDGDELDDLIPE